MHSDAGQPATRSPLLFIFLTVFIDLLGFGIVIPLLPTYSKMHAASEFELGLLMGCFSGMQFLCAPVWGRLSDRIGRRPVLIGGLVGTALSYLVFAHARSLALLYVSRLLAGFFAANIAAAQAYIADVTKPEDRAKGMGLIGVAFGLGFMFGPPLGGWLNQIDLRLPGYAAALLSCGAALFGFIKLREPARHAAESSRLFTLEDVRGARANPRLGTLYLLSYLSIFAFAAFEAMFTRYGLTLFPSVFAVADPRAPTEEELKGAGLIAGLYLFGIGVLAAVVQGGLIRRLIPKYGEVALLVVGPLILGIALAIVGGAPTTAWWVVISGCFLMPFGFGLTSPAVNGLISIASPVERQGAYLGMGQSLSSLARLTGPIIAGLLFTHVSPRAPFLFAAAVLLLASGIAASYKARHGASFARVPKETSR